MATDLYHCPDQKKIQQLKDLANRLRVLSIESTTAAKSGWVYWDRFKDQHQFSLEEFSSIAPENRGILTHFMSHVSFYSPWKQKTTKWSNTLKQFVDCCQQIVWVCLTILWFSNVFRAFQGFFQVFFHITGFVFQIKFVKVPRPFLTPKTWRNQQGVCRAL